MVVIRHAVTSVAVACAIVAGLIAFAYYGEPIYRGDMWTVPASAGGD